MPRGPLSEESKQRAAKRKLDELASSLGIELDYTGVEAFSAINEKTHKEVQKTAHEFIKTHEDQILEANAVLLYYFRVPGVQFKDRECKNCGLIFAYHWDCDNIYYCSIDCMKAALAKIGIEWDISRPLGTRYQEMHYKSRPMIVPPDALKIVHDLQESHPDDTSNA